MNLSWTKEALRWLTLSFIVLALSACTLPARNKPSDPSSDKNERTKIVVTQEMSADEIADAGEQLVTPYTFMLADKTFNLALKKNAAHNKALFYKAFLKRFMVFKGILARMKPLVAKQGDLKDYQRKIQSLPESPLKAFLMDGPADIKDIYSAQGFLNEYVRAVNYLREFLLQNPEMNFTIYLNPYLHEESIEKSWSKSCRALPTRGELMHVECDPREIALRRVNAADLMMLRQVAAGEVLALSIYASYSLEGLENLSKTERFDQLPYHTQRQLLKANPEFATLRRDHVMDLVSYIAQDFVAASRWAERFKKELCPKGFDIAGEQTQRDGYLFSEGFCLAEDDESVTARETLLAQIEGALRGSVPLQIQSQDKEVTVESVIDPLALSRRPVIDLKALLPEQLPTCGKLVELPDPTLGGVFPRRDASIYLSRDACKH